MSLTVDLCKLQLNLLSLALCQDDPGGQEIRASVRGWLHSRQRTMDDGSVLHEIRELIVFNKLRVILYADGCEF